MRREDFALCHPLRVRWAEIDRQGIVFNGHYLAYFDIGITEYWRAISYPYPDALLQAGCDTFVVKATVEYHAPAVYDDMLDVLVRVARIGRTSMNFNIEVHRADARLISGEVIYVIADPQTRKPMPVPDFLRQAIAGFERVALES
ncbi:MAG: thioesterase family protein [Betaproteobacteria bacterium]